MKRFKAVMLGVACFAVASMCAACGGKGPGGDEPGGDIGGNIDPDVQITLNIESAAPLRFNYKALLSSEKPGTQLYNQALFSQRLVDGFKKLYPNIRLKFTEDGWGDALYQTQQLYIRDYNQGGAMAVDLMIGETYMGYFAQNGVFAELNGEKFSDVLEGAYADMNIGGKIYGVPMCTNVMGLQYNTDILREAQIPEEDWVPETWDELKENCKKVSDYAKANGKNYGGIVMNNVSGMSGAFRAVPFLRQAGGDIMKDGQLTVNSAENIEAFTYLRELAQYAYSDSLTSTSEDTLQYYFTTQNRGAYMVELAVSMANAGDNIKSAPLPTKNADGTGVGNVYCGNVLFGVTKGSKNKAAAQAFLEYLTSAEVQNWLYELDGRLPVNKTTLQSEEIKTVHPNINPYIEQLNNGGFNGGLACFTNNSQLIWSSWGTFYSNVLRTTTDIKTLADAVQNDIKNKM